jgi:hypothetical protein
MSKFRRMPRAAWFIAGAAITLVLVPSVAVAAGLTFDGIEGTSKNKADVAKGGSS